MRKSTAIAVVSLLLPLALSGELFSQQLVNPARSQRLNPPYKESIYLHINTNFLLTGETLLFKAYCVDSRTNILSDLSRVAYIELIDQNLQPFFQTKILLAHGVGWGDLFLPSGMPTGNYTLIAYTKWMKNFPIADFFRSEITVINPFNRGFAGSKRKPKNVAVSFFPEGGLLIAGIENKIGFRGVNETGKPVTFKGKILDETGKPIVEFTPAQDGAGSFEMTPEAAKSYKAIVEDSLGNVYFTVVPPAAREGIAMRMSEDATGFRIRLEDHFGDQRYNLVAELLVKGALLRQFPVEFVNRVADISVEKKSAPAGALTVRIISPRGEVLAQEQLHNETSRPGRMVMTPGARAYDLRQKMVIDLANKDSLLGANVSVTVHQIEDRIPSKISIADNLAHSGGIQSRSALPGGAGVKFLPDFRGDLITGTVVDKDTRAPLSQGLVYLSAPSVDFTFLISQTDSTGHFYFNVDDFRPGSDIVLQLGDDVSHGYVITVDADFLDKYEAFVPSTLEVDTTIRKIIERRSVFNQVENAFYAVKKDSIIRRNTSRFYGVPDKIYKLDDYTRFPTMEDILREYVPEVTVRKRKDKFELRIINSHNGNPFSEAPLILLDGIPIHDTDVVMKYDPLKIRSMEILRRHYFYSALQVGGILSLLTYDGEAKDLVLPGAIHKSYAGNQLPKYYYSPVYDAGKDLSRVPDFRTQLGWSPDISLAAGERRSLEFYTGDTEGDFEIEVEGLQSNGDLIFLRQRVHVGAGH